MSVAGGAPIETAESDGNPADAHHVSDTVDIHNLGTGFNDDGGVNDDELEEMDIPLIDFREAK